MKIYAPKSSESPLPLFVIDGKIRFNFFCQLRQPFGLLIRVPFMLLRWGSA
jgi:hypothetical protein